MIQLPFYDLEYNLLSHWYNFLEANGVNNSNKLLKKYNMEFIDNLYYPEDVFVKCESEEDVVRFMMEWG